MIANPFPNNFIAGVYFGFVAPNDWKALLKPWDK